MGRVGRAASIVDRLARESGRGDAGALDAMAAAGLAEATLLVRCEQELSDGQRARFALARAMAACSRARRPTCLIVDEFASTLDAATASSLSASVSRWARARGVACVLATAREDVIEGLGADVMVYVGLGAGIEVWAGSQSTKRQSTQHKEEDRLTRRG